MFQTEPIKFLQSMSSEWLTDFMLLVSQLGYSSFYIPALITVTIGVNFRKGFLLMQMLLWVGLLTDLLKNLIALPRPSDVDSAVLLLKDNIPNPTPFTGMGGQGFWDLPDPEAIRVVRYQPDWSYGLPSGHVSGTVTFWVGLSRLFKPVVIKVAAIAMVILMPLSRMYLGRHFLADVVGGFLLAVGLLAVAHFLFVRPGTHGRLLTLDRLLPSVDRRVVLFLVVFLAAPLVFLALSPLVEPEAAGRMFGVNAAFVVLAMNGLPDDAASWVRRCGRVALAFVIYLCVTLLVGRVVDAASIDDSIPWVEFLIAAIPVFVSFWIGVRVCQKLGLFTKKAVSGPGAA